MRVRFTFSRSPNLVTILKITTQNSKLCRNMGLRHFPPLGAYSYSHRALDGVQTVGRYCSIAENVEVMGNGHPTQWVSSSPVFYNPKRLNRFGVVGLSVDLQNVKGALQSGMTSGLGKVCVCDAGFGSVTVQSSLQVPSSRVMCPILPLSVVCPRG